MTSSNLKSTCYFNEETISLLKKAKENNKEALEILIKNNIGLINSIVKKYLNNSVSYDDLFQIASIGFIKAVNKFDFNYENKFSTYAVYVIDGEIRRFFRDDGVIKVSRALKTIYLKCKKVREEYLLKCGNEISIEELSKITGYRKEEIYQAMDACKTPEYLYDKISTNNKDDSSMYLFEKIQDEKETEEKVIDNIDLKNAINSLPKIERQIIVLRYFANKTQREIAAILNISQVQVSRIEKKTINQIRLNMI